ncbi:MAG: cupredoxin domain-containing protein [Actinobacteria bacterium]|nr:cupredoxin domain-containing protein [Actinomycetota bacterium]
MRRGPGRALVLLAALALWWGCGDDQPAPPAGAGPLTVVQDDAELLHRSDAQMAGVLDDLRAAGVDWVRVTAGWSVIAPAPEGNRPPAGFDATDPGAYPRGAWDRLDRLARMTRERELGLSIDIAFWAPRWAVAEPVAEPDRQRTVPDPRHFADFAEAVERIETWEAENCPGAGGDEEEEEEEEQAAPQTPDPDATRVAVTATDFQFAIEGDVPAEKVAFVMTNEGQVPHHMAILKLKEGTTAEQADRSFQDATVPELVEKEVGQSSNAAPGEDAVINAELEPGPYLMFCFVDEPDGVPHAFKGMRTVFEVS